uniref:Uncharacterized protein n=1 Tax=Arundo donax TaxID=35708 RepID=A0A0A9D4P3_ARUDO
MEQRSVIRRAGKKLQRYLLHYLKLVMRVKDSCTHIVDNLMRENKNIYIISQ